MIESLIFMYSTFFLAGFGLGYKLGVFYRAFNPTI